MIANASLRGCRVPFLLISTVLLLGCLAPAVRAADDEAAAFDSPWVVNLTDKNFDDFVTNSSSWVLEFYAPWCSHCKALAKGYAAAAEAASGKGLSFGKVDCTQNGGLVKRFGIRGFPTLKFWRDGHVRSYRHPRTQEGLIEFGALVTAPAVVSVANAAALAELEAKHPVLMLVLTPPAAADSTTGGGRQKLVQMAQQQYTPLARRYQGVVPWFTSSDAALFERFNHGKSAESVVLVAVKYDPKNEYSHFTFFPGTHPETLALWVESHRRPLVTELDALNFEDVTTSGRRTLIAVTDAEHQPAESKALLAEMHKLCKGHWASAHHCGYLPANKWKTYLERFSIGAAHLPTVFVLDGPNEVYWQPAHLAGGAVGPIQPHQIHQFLSDFHELKLTARGNTPFSFGGIMKRITTFIESFSDTELLIGAVGIFVVCLVVMIGIASCCSDAPPPTATQRKAALAQQQQRRITAAPSSGAAAANKVANASASAEGLTRRLAAAAAVAAAAGGKSDGGAAASASSASSSSAKDE